MKIIGIYKIQKKNSTDCYIGQSIDIVRRWAEHKLALDKNKHTSSRLQNSWNVHGEINFEFTILETGFDKTNKVSLTTAEQKWMDTLSPVYNTLPANFSRLGVPCSEETRAKMSKARIGKVQSKETIEKRMAHLRGRAYPPPSDEARDNMAIGQLGRILTAEAKKKISESKIGKPKSEKTKAKISATLTGRPGHPCSEELKKKISEIQTGKTVSEDTRTKLREANLGKILSEEHKSAIAEGGRRSRAAKKLAQV